MLNKRIITTSQHGYSSCFSIKTIPATRKTKRPAPFTVLFIHGGNANSYTPDTVNTFNHNWSRVVPAAKYGLNIKQFAAIIYKRPAPVPQACLYFKLFYLRMAVHT